MKRGRHRHAANAVMLLGVAALSTVSAASLISSSSVTYTTEGDFNLGSSINLQILPDPTNHHLELLDHGEAFDFIWVAASARGTIVKIDTNTGAILGEYRSTPSSHGWGDPSRTTVDSDGSVWASNRNNVGNIGGQARGTIIHIGLLENNQCEDRNGNGVIDTSTGLGDIRPWIDDSGARGVATADDECIVHYLPVNSIGTRHVSVDSNNDVWVGGLFLRNYDLVKGGRFDVPLSGTIIRSEFSVGFGGYGGLIDSNGVIWSARPLLRWPVVNPLTGLNGDVPGPSIGPLLPGTNWAGQGTFDSYGLCIDPAGNVWNTQLFGNLIHKYAPDGTYLGGFSHGNDAAQGCVADGNGDIWVAHSLFSATTVGHVLNDGTFVGNVPLPGSSGPTGVAVDRNGKVWAANINSNNVSRIDPSAGPIGGGEVPIGQVDLTVSIGAGAGPYNYSDMTGSTLTAAPNNGSWTVTYDSGEVDAEWGTIFWNDEPDGCIPGDSQLIVEARSSTDGVNWSPFEAVTYGMDLTVPDGQFLQVRVSFIRATTGESPCLADLTIMTAKLGGGEGCSPGLWKQPHHFGHWVGYHPDDMFCGIFNCSTAASITAYGGKSLAQVLGQGGGQLRALGRHAVAALLNASSSVSYDLSVAQVIQMVNAAIASNNNTMINSAKDELDELNNQGCPLSGHAPLGHAGAAAASINELDLVALLNNWGRPGSTDLNGDGVTDAIDVLLLLGTWGTAKE